MYRILGADNKEYGPVSGEQLRGWIAENRANAGTLALAEGSTTWKPLREFPEFSLLFASQRPPVLAPLPAARKSTSLATTGLVFGIISVTFGMCCCYGFPFNVLGLAFSIAALVQIRAHPDLYEGHGMAIGGLVLSIASLVLTGLVGLFSTVTFWGEMPRHMIHRL
ncbi:MAG TPA: DUF4190 domain-containing protein [Verrucomicrobiae bacterium]|jgi:hypothetical protein|nr:DUF4190 domain-containing protein [Verrucomicrobiae bacterium]